MLARGNACCSSMNSTRLEKNGATSTKLEKVKRVVSSLLLQIDALPSYVVVVTASNHPELLDARYGGDFKCAWNCQCRSKAKSRNGSGGSKREAGTHWASCPQYGPEFEGFEFC